MKTTIIAEAATQQHILEIQVSNTVTNPRVHILGTLWLTPPPVRADMQMPSFIKRLTFNYLNVFTVLFAIMTFNLHKFATIGLKSGNMANCHTRAAVTLWELSTLVAGERLSQ